MWDCYRTNHLQVTFSQLLAGCGDVPSEYRCPTTSTCLSSSNSSSYFARQHHQQCQQQHDDDQEGPGWYRLHLPSLQDQHRRQQDPKLPSGPQYYWAGGNDNTEDIDLEGVRSPEESADVIASAQVMPHHRATIHLNCENSEMLEQAYKDAKEEGTFSRFDFPVFFTPIA